MERTHQFVWSLEELPVDAGPMVEATAIRDRAEHSGCLGQFQLLVTFAAFVRF